jgi:hypothetical protein
MRKINAKCAKSNRKRCENNSKKWKKQLPEVREANERAKSNSGRGRNQLKWECKATNIYAKSSRKRCEK